MALTFPKAEKLCGKQEISTLLDHGRRGGNGPLRYCCLSPNGQEVSRLLVSVPKKHFKRAVKRNLLKRRIREAYRLQKDLLPEGAPSFDLLLTYVSDEVLAYADIRDAVAAILTEIAGWKR